MKHPLVLGITGASGAAYAVRLLEVLLHTGHDVHLTISPSGKTVLAEELKLHVSLEHFDPASLLPVSDVPADRRLELTRAMSGISSGDSSVLAVGQRAMGSVIYHHYRDFMTPIASGSFLTGGMVICPCSGGTLSAVVNGASTNLIQRAADVHLKERRKLILVPRETPLSIIMLDNMKRACEAGAIVLPAMPGWYHGVRTLRDLVDFIVARILDQLGIEHALMKRWAVEEDDV